MVSKTWVDRWLGLAVERGDFRSAISLTKLKSYRDYKIECSASYEEWYRYRNHLIGEKE